MKTFLKGKIAPVVIVVVGALIFIGMGKLRKAPEKSGAETVAVLVQTTSFTAGTETLMVHGTGAVMPAEQVSLVPQVQGNIVYVGPNAENGSRFVKGEVLFRIDPKEYELRLASAQSALAMQRMNYKMEEENARIARDEWDAYAMNHPEAPEASALTLREPQLELAQANLAAAEAAVGLAELALERTELKAPFNGRIQAKNVSAGQLVGPGTAVAVLHGTDKARITVPVKKEDTEWLQRRGNRFTGTAVVSVGFGNRTYSWPGRVTGDMASLDPRSRMVNLTVEVKWPYSRKHERPLQSGLFTDVSIRGRVLNDIYRIPRNLLQADNTVHTNVDGTMRIKRVDVLRLQGSTALINGGLSGDDAVIISRIELPVDGMKIRTAGNE